MGVVILLATPGPWQRVVGQRAAGPARGARSRRRGRLRDGRPRRRRARGVLWLHLDAERHALTAVVVAPRVSGFSPTDGYAPVAAIAGSAGPSAAAAALGGALGVSMDAWIALDRKALDLAVEPMFPMNEVRAARTRYREARAAWRGLGGAEDAWATQYESLRVALPAGRVRRARRRRLLQLRARVRVRAQRSEPAGGDVAGRGAQGGRPRPVEVRAAPVVVERCRGGEVWHADASRVEPLHQSLRAGHAPARRPDGSSRRARGPRACSWSRRCHALNAARYAAEVRRRLARSAGARRRGDARLGRGRPAGVPRRPRARQAAGAGRAGRAGPPRRRGRRRRHQGLRDAAQAPRRRRSSRARCSPGTAEASGPTPGGAGGRRRRRPAAGLLAAGRGARRRRRRRGRRRSWPPRAPTSRRSSGRAGRGRSRRSSVRPASDFAFVAARHTGVGVVSASDAAAAALLPRLRLWGFSGRASAARRRRLAAAGDRAGHLLPAGVAPGAALALAGDLGLPAGSVAKAGDTPRKLVVISTGAELELRVTQNADGAPPATGGAPSAQTVIAVLSGAGCDEAAHRRR